MTLLPASVLALGLAGAVCVSGCRQDEPRTRGDTRPLAGDTDMRGTLRTTQLEEAGVPPEIRPVILNDVGDATIASAQAVPTEGGLIYRVTYYGPDGVPQQATYSSTGQRIVVPTRDADGARLAGEETGQQQGMQPGGQPGAQPGMQPGDQPGDRPGQQPQRGTTEPGTGAGGSGTGPGTGGSGTGSGTGAGGAGGTGGGAGGGTGGGTGPGGGR